MIRSARPSPLKSPAAETDQPLLTDRVAEIAKPPPEALAMLENAKMSNQTGSSGRIVDSLLREVKRDLSERRDIDRQKVIDQAVKDLSERFREMKKQGVAVPSDAWTRPTAAISLLGFEVLGADLNDSVGLDQLIADELARGLQAKQFPVVERALLDKLLAELNLGSSALADPETQLRLGKITAARLIATGRITSVGGARRISLRLIDTETSRVVFSHSEELGGRIDPVSVADALMSRMDSLIRSSYPVRGRIVALDREEIVINLGRKQGVVSGDLFNVLAEGKPVEYQGKVIGARDVVVGSLRVVAVDEQMAVGVRVSGDVEFRENQKLASTR